VIFTAAALRALPWAWIAVVVALLAAIGAGIAWHVHRVDLARTQGHTAGAAEIQARWDASTIENQRHAARAESARRSTEQEREAVIRQEIEHAQLVAEQVLADSGRARAESERLRIATAATAARCRARGPDPGPAAVGPPASSAGDLLAYVQGRLDEAAGELAEEADRRGSAGASCERIHDALKRGGKTGSAPVSH
jgi:hypothetical protein